MLTADPESDKKKKKGFTYQVKKYTGKVTHQMDKTLQDQCVLLQTIYCISKNSNKDLEEIFSAEN